MGRSEMANFRAVQKENDRLNRTIKDATVKRLKERGKPYKLVIIAIARRLITIANAIIKTGTPWKIQPNQ